jgi:arylsulfatase A-like enzyme
VIFILVDDHRWDMMSAAAHPWLRTPHLDAMAAGGASFRNAHLDAMAAGGASFRNAFVTTSL